MNAKRNQFINITTNTDKSQPFCRYGTEAKNGKLYLFGKKSILVIRAWPMPAAWFKAISVKKGYWRHVRPNIQLKANWVNPFENRLRKDRSLAELIADEIRYPELPTCQKLVLETVPETHVESLPNVAVPELIKIVAPQFSDLATPLPASRPNPKTKARQELQRIREFELRRNHFAIIPEGFRERISRFQERQWHILSMLARCPESSDLIDSNPALAFALASCWCFRKGVVSSSMRAIRRLLPKQQRIISGYLDFPASESTCKILRKVPPASFNIEVLLRLRWALNTGHQITLLNHIPRLNAAIIALLTCKSAAFLTTAFYHELSDYADRRFVPLLYCKVMDIIRMSRDICRELPKRIDCMEQLVDVHDEVLKDYTVARHSDLLRLTFPPPPLPGNSDVIPITTPKQLLEEGRDQHNCVSSYGLRIANGVDYIYRIESSTRATIQVHRDPGAIYWQLGEVAGPMNRPVDSSTMQRIQQWFQSNAINH